MLLRYPTTSYASSLEDLTGGYMVRFELAVIRFFKEWFIKQRIRAELNALSPRELRDIGISYADIDSIVDGTSDLCRTRRGYRF